MVTVRLARRASALALLPFALDALSASPALAQVPPIGPEPYESVRPWFYTSSGDLVWERHQFGEGTTNTVFSLAFDFVTVPGQAAARPDVLLLTGPHYDPPEGMPAGNGTRKFLRGSIEGRALRVYVNYGGVPIGANPTPTYLEPTFFVSLSPPNIETDPPVPDVGLSGTFIAPTRAALGNVGAPGLQNMRARLLHEPGPPLPPFATLNGLYITAGVGVALSEFNAASLADVTAAIQDRLFIRQPDETWLDRSDLVPVSARDGNSSGACFADFNGDGYMDLFVGKPGDDYGGAQSRLLIYRPPGPGVPEAFVDETASRMPSYPNAATVDVAAADLDGDGDQDIVVANRARRSGAIGTESLDYAFVNGGTGVFTRLDLAPGVYSDSRTVAVGELDYVPGPEIVLGNAGADGFSNTLVIPPSSDHPLQIFRDLDPSPTLAFQDTVSDFVSNESEISRPFTWQVLIADLFSPTGFMPDGAPDLVLVNHRDILRDWSPDPPGMRNASNVRILVNKNLPPTRQLIAELREEVSWATTIALADFSYNTAVCAANTLDLFIGTGNSFSGSDAAYLENCGSHATNWPPWNASFGMYNHLTYDAMPGNERGYGFDFADLNDNGWMDALQTSRAYNFLVTDMMVDTGAHVDGNRHWNLTRSASTVDFSNKRGQLFPLGFEDGVFADFDGDGILEALLAGQTRPSATYPPPVPETGETVLLHRSDTNSPGFLHDVTTVPAFNAPDPANPNITRDLYIDIRSRNEYNRPPVGDRAYAVDVDNDGDVDAWVHLFGIAGEGITAVPRLGADGLLSPIGRYSAGWRLLVNVTTGPGAPAPWFQDLADRRLHDGSFANGFSPLWNRTLGVDVLADFDNNGACDFFTAVGGPQAKVIDVTDLHQGHELLFMNKFAGAPVGHFVESSTALSIPQRELPLGGPKTSTAGCSGLAQGDIDNDGDADLFVSSSKDEFFGELLINKVQASGRFDDEFTARVPTAASLVGTKIHSLPFVNDATRIHDEAGSPILVDLDADGDLDLIYAVSRNVPRIYRNRGQDSNQDGFITAADNPPPGTFEDWTDEWVQRIRPIFDSVDAQAVDVDRDGDFDLFFDCFNDEVVPMRNDVAHQGGRPAITDAWPRVGRVRGRKLELEGVNLTGAVAVELISRANGTTVVVPQSAITSESYDGGNFGNISFTLPVTVPLGLVQIRVKRANPPTPAEAWSRQYFGYFVLGS